MQPQTDKKKQRAGGRMYSKDQMWQSDIQPDRQTLAYNSKENVPDYPKGEKDVIMRNVSEANWKDRTLYPHTAKDLEPLFYTVRHFLP